jgi:septum site-determining protein MinC
MTVNTRFEIKSANLPLVALLLKSPDLAQLAQALAQRFGDIPDFFDNDPLLIDLSPLADAQAAIDFEALLDLLKPYRVLPLAVRGGSPAQMAAAALAGLVPAPDAVMPRPMPDPVAQPMAMPETEAAPVDEPLPPLVSAGALVIDKPLRSGQQVYAKGRDLVVLHMVNPGAEVIADGHIHVYAPLRGKAIAGARGNTEARIFAFSLQAELLSIAGVYRTSEVPLPAHVLGKPTQVRLEGGSEGKLVFEGLSS